MSWPLYPWGKNLWYPSDRKLGGSRPSLDVVQMRKIFSLLVKKLHLTSP
jgi:hypothetical protein